MGIAYETTQHGCSRGGPPNLTDGEMIAESDPRMTNQLVANISSSHEMWTFLNPWPEALFWVKVPFSW